MNQNYNQRYFQNRDFIPKPLVMVLKKLLQDKKIKKILEVGCGSGWLIRYLKKYGYDIIGCDSSREAIKISGQIQAPATKLPFSDHLFDMVIAISLIEHLKPQEVEEFLKESRRVLKPKGYIFLVTPNFLSPGRFLKGKKWFGYLDPSHINFYTPFSLGKLLKDYGFWQIKFTHQIPYYPKLHWAIPQFLKRSPRFFQHFINYLIISSPLAFIRDSLWVKAKLK